MASLTKSPNVSVLTNFVHPLNTPFWEAVFQSVTSFYVLKEYFCIFTCSERLNMLSNIGWCFVKVRWNVIKLVARRPSFAVKDFPELFSTYDILLPNFFLLQTISYLFLFKNFATMPSYFFRPIAQLSFDNRFVFSKTFQSPVLEPIDNIISFQEPKCLSSVFDNF